MRINASARLPRVEDITSRAEKAAALQQGRYIEAVKSVLRDIESEIKKKSPLLTGYGRDGWRVTQSGRGDKAIVGLSLTNSGPSSWNGGRLDYMYRPNAYDRPGVAHKTLKDHRHSGPCNKKVAKLGRMMANPNATWGYIEEAFAVFGLNVTLTHNQIIIKNIEKFNALVKARL